MKIYFLLSLILLASQVFSLPYGKDLFSKIQQSEVQHIIRSNYGKSYKYVFIPKSANVGFTWDNCAPGSNLNIKKLSVQPNPFDIPSNVTVGLSANITTEITDITSVELKVEKKLLGFYVEVPCVENVGSCTYNNICPMLAKITCPQQLIDMGFTCSCPFKAKDYEVPDGTVIPIPSISIPSIADGDFKIKATLKNGDTTLGCYDFKITISKSGSLRLVMK